LIAAKRVSVAAGRLRSAGHAKLGQAFSDEARALEGSLTGDPAAQEQLGQAGRQAADIARKEHSVQRVLLALFISHLRVR